MAGQEKAAVRGLKDGMTKYYYSFDGSANDMYKKYI